MKTATTTTFKTADRLALPALAMFWLLPSISPAQTAGNFQPDLPLASQATPATREIEADAEPVASPPDVPDTPNDTPSRYVSEADLDAYVKTVAANFGINKQIIDSFGQYQDPTKRPVIKPKPTKTSKRYQPVKKTPFSQIVRYIKVTTVMPGEKRFLVGTRSMKLGDRFPIQFRGRNINVEVAGVDSTRVRFRNVETGETGDINLNLLPTGMTPGNGGITAPGMVPDNSNAPLQIESSAL
ncbi:MAG: hypothetical protein ACQCXQ_13485 [Verrucomicrobiales bacterium]